MLEFQLEYQVFHLKQFLFRFQALLQSEFFAEIQREAGVGALLQN